MKSYAFQVIRLLNNDAVLDANQKALIARLTCVMAELKGLALVNGLIDFAESCYAIADKTPWYHCVGSIAIMFAEMANRQDREQAYYSTSLKSAYQQWNESMLNLEMSKLISDLRVRMREIKQATRQLALAYDIFSRQGKEQDAQLCMEQLQQAEKTLWQLQAV